MKKFVEPDIPFAAATLDLTRSEFQQIREIARNRFGLDLREGKERLVASRLAKHVRSGGFRSFTQYVEHVVEDRTGESLIQLINALSTNHTSFFRETRHFEFLATRILPAFAGRELGVWSAASSTGEEPYSIAMTVLEQPAGRRPARTRILATDVSTRVLDIGREAVYPKDKLDSVPERFRSKYFRCQNTQACPHWQVAQEAKALVEFRRLNLMDRFEFKGLFQLIFCRNVMIYFDRPTQADLVRRFDAVLQPGGYLFVGHSESLTGIDHPFEYVEPAIYLKPARGGPR